MKFQTKSPFIKFLIKRWKSQTPSFVAELDCRCSNFLKFDATKKSSKITRFVRQHYV